jgi:hypothetical protein
MTHVWGIGLTRTGTTTLNAALRILGYDSTHWPTTHELLYGDLPAATDECVSALYKYLDFRFPGSKFVLTERNEEAWLRSTEKHRRDVLTAEYLHRLQFAPRTAENERRYTEVVFTQMTLYGTLAFDEAKFRHGYRQYHADLERYFANRPRDLLCLRICEGEGWEKLAPFLGHAVPSVPFPYEGMLLDRPPSSRALP